MPDDYICTVCHQKVKTKLKRAHESGAKHRENLRRQTAPKRPALVEAYEEEQTVVKRSRSDQEPIEYHSAASRLPEQKEEEQESTSALPANFFDSSAKKKAETDHANLEKELSKLISEVNKIEKKEEEIDNKEDALRNDLEMIDEQIEMWRNLNELEKQKEQLLAGARARVGTDEAKAGVSDKGDKTMEEDESDEEFDAFGLDWRSRKI